MKAIVLCAATLLLSACDFGQDCTLAACGPSVTVHIEGLEEAGEFSALLHVPGEDPFQLDCWSNTECVSPQASDDFTPSTFTVTIETADTTHSRTFSPAYVTRYPNGEECGPRCRHAEVTFVVE